MSLAIRFHSLQHLSKQLRLIRLYKLYFIKKKYVKLSPDLVYDEIIFT